MAPMYSEIYTRTIVGRKRVLARPLGYAPADIRALRKNLSVRIDPAVTDSTINGQ